MTTIKSDRPFIVLYRWRIRPGLEDQFVEGWTRVSRGYQQQRGSLGARLHRGSDGIWYSYAVWPSSQARAEAFAAGSPDAEGSVLVKEAIEGLLPEIILDLAVALIDFGSRDDT